MAMLLKPQNFLVTLKTAGWHGAQAFAAIDLPG